MDWLREGSRHELIDHAMTGRYRAISKLVPSDEDGTWAPQDGELSPSARLELELVSELDRLMAVSDAIALELDGGDLTQEWQGLVATEGPSIMMPARKRPPVTRKEQGMLALCAIMVVAIPTYIALTTTFC